MNELKVTNENISQTDYIIVNADDVNLHVSPKSPRQNLPEQQTSSPFQVNNEMIAEMTRQTDAERKADMDQAFRYFAKGWFLRKIAIFTGLSALALPVVSVAYEHFWGWPWGTAENFIMSVLGICVLCAIICLFSILFWQNYHNKANEILERYNQEIPL